MMDWGLIAFLARGAWILLVFLVVHLLPWALLVIGIDRAIRGVTIGKNEYTPGDLIGMIGTPLFLGAMFLTGYMGEFFRFADANFEGVFGLSFIAFFSFGAGVWVGRRWT